ncbi:MAG: hypothetical protein EPO24_11100 [Bacteroidetes bacterium]|nr:MAG: hypothetical protein EPO24_11100 [Bacteroidota bacterium]
MSKSEKAIDEKTVEQLAAIFCTKEEIASVVGCSVETLNERFVDALKRGKDKGKASLRRKQWESIENGNITMLVWFGKQFLGQTEKMENALNDEQYNELLAAAHAAMVHLSGAGRATSGHSTVQA